MTGQREAPIVGRAAEIARLEAAFTATRAGRFSLALIRGEPGIGKTRLVEELGRRVGERAVVAWGRVDEAAGSPPYWPWTQMLGSALAAVGPEAATQALGEDPSRLAGVLPQLSAGSGAASPDRDPVAARFQVHLAVADVLRRLSAGCSLVLALDDLHRADVASLELMRFLAHHLVDVPLLLVATYRTVDTGGSPVFDDVRASLARTPGLVQLDISGLSEPEVGEFISRTVGDSVQSVETIAALHARTEGNPFYVGELVRLMRGRQPPHGDDVPLGVRDVLRQRLVRLPEAGRELLLLGAVLGRDVDPRILARAAGVSELTALDQIGGAITAGFLLEDPLTGQLRFAHALTRDTIYGELSPLRRATLHARVAETLEQNDGDSTHRLAERAEHFARAAPVLGPERGAHYALRAAEEAQTVLAYEQAEELVRRALGLIALQPAGQERDEQELHAQNRLAALLITTRGHGDADVGRVCLRARELSATAEPSPELIRTLATLANFHVVNGDFDMCLELGAQLEAIGEQQDDPLASTLGAFCDGLARPNLHDLPQGRRALARAVERARELPLTDDLTAAFGAHMLPVALIFQARYAALAEDRTVHAAAIAEASRVARRSGHEYTIAFTGLIGLLGSVLLEEPAQVAQRAQTAVADCAAGGFELHRAWCSISYGWALCECGELERGLAETDAGLRTHRAMRSTFHTAYYLALACDARRRAGDMDVAMELIEEAIACCEEDVAHAYEADLHRRRGELLAAAGPEHRAAAIEALNTAAGIARAQGIACFERRALEALARAAPDAASAGGGAEPVVSLSARERELLRLLASGRTDKQIAAELVISVRTVGSHLDRIRDKTGRRRRPELTRLADELGLGAGLPTGGDASVA